MSREYKNTLPLRDKAYGEERRRNLAKEVLKDSTPFPSPVDYRDIDEEFKKWVEEELYTTYDGKELPTYFMLSNQRFSEYVQSWENVDDKKNIILNFKYITREYNPQTGTINGQTKNIPGEQWKIIKRVVGHDKANREYYIDYKMKQPFGVDLKYTISVVTNKLEILNTFNEMLNNKFKAITAYIRPNGHFMSMTLNNISDQTDNSLDDRRYYSQSYEITVRAYIIREDFFEVEETPKLSVYGFNDGGKGAYAQINEDVPPYCEPNNPYVYQALEIEAIYERCLRKLSFTMDTYMQITDIEPSENVRSFDIYVNDSLVYTSGDEIKPKWRLYPNDRVEIRNFNPYRMKEGGTITIKGYDWQTGVKIEK